MRKKRWCGITLSSPAWLLVMWCMYIYGWWRSFAARREYKAARHVRSVPEGLIMGDCFFYFPLWKDLGIWLSKLSFLSRARRYASVWNCLLLSFVSCCYTWGRADIVGDTSVWLECNWQTEANIIIWVFELEVFLYFCNIGDKSEIMVELLRTNSTCSYIRNLFRAVVTL